MTHGGVSECASKLSCLFVSSLQLLTWSILGINQIVVNGYSICVLKFPSLMNLCFLSLRVSLSSLS